MILRRLKWHSLKTIVELEINRKLSRTSYCCVYKPINELENAHELPSKIVRHVRSLLVQNPEYKEYLFDPETLLLNNDLADLGIDSSDSVNEIKTKSLEFHSVAKKFAELSKGPDLESLDDDSYFEIISEIEKNVTVMSDQDLCLILYAMANFPRNELIHDEKYKRLWKCLDDECVARANESWTTRQIFVMDDVWAPLRINCDFYWKKVIRRFVRSADSLNKIEFVRLMYSVSRTKMMNRRHFGFELEHNWARLFDQLTLNEIIVIVITFIRSRKVVEEKELVKKVIEKAIENVDSLKSMDSSLISNFIARTACFGVEEQIVKFIKAFTPHVETLDPKALVTLANTGFNANCVDYGFANAISGRLEQNLSSLSLAHIGRMTAFAGKFNLQSNPSLAKKVVHELQRPDRQREIEILAVYLPGILHYLSMAGEIYLEDLIDRVLSKEFLRKHYGKQFTNYDYDVLHLDINTQIEKPSYSGNKLEDKMKRRLMKKRTFNFSHNGGYTKVSRIEILLKEMNTIIREMYNEPDYDLLISSFLPQFHSGAALFCTDRLGNPVEIPKVLKEFECYEPKIIPKDLIDGSIVFHLFCPANRYNMIFGTNDVTGQTHLYERILGKLGYHVHRIYCQDWTDASPEGRKKLTKSIISKGCKMASEQIKKNDEKQLKV